jgi:hypothetical protein
LGLLGDLLFAILADHALYLKADYADRTDFERPGFELALPA